MGEVGVVQTFLEMTFEQWVEKPPWSNNQWTLWLIEDWLSSLWWKNPKGKPPGHNPVASSKPSLTFWWQKSYGSVEQHFWHSSNCDMEGEHIRLSGWMNDWQKIHWTSVKLAHYICMFFEKYESPQVNFHSKICNFILTFCPQTFHKGLKFWLPSI